MNTNKLVVHTGGWTATEDQIHAVPVPERTRFYTPISHGRVIEELRRLLPFHGMKIDRMTLALARGGNQMFGTMDVVNGQGRPDWGIAVGFRNSYDRSFSLGLCAGSRVFVCDNLAFHGSVTLKERHVGRLDAKLPNLFDGLINGVSAYKAEMAAQIDNLKSAEIDDSRAHDLMIRSLRQGIVHPNNLAVVAKEWHEPTHEEFSPRTAWSLFNAYTEAAKLRSPDLQMNSTLSLNRLFADEFANAN